jgi:acyl-CoA reductase-like NAD-dependent aldehyde dehydrogenase
MVQCAGRLLMLERVERSTETGEGASEPAESLPTVAVDDAYLAGVAARVQAMTGQAPLWYSASPAEQSESLLRWAEQIRREWEAEGGDAPAIPTEAMRRENMYD